MARHSLPKSTAAPRTAYHRTHAWFMIYAYSTIAAAVSTVVYVWHGVS